MPAATDVPALIWIWPFVAILLAIALLPLLPHVHRLWEHNGTKLIVSLALSAVALGYYQLRGFGLHESKPGWPAVAKVLEHSLLEEYVPFMVLLLSLFVIAGGIVLRGDIRATPLVNTTILAIGGVLANVIGTTGASMVLIRPLLRTNSERRNTVHTFVFFIFIVSNVGGLLLPLGDPPLFLGYLRGVPFFWTSKLWKEWATALGLLLAIYFVWDTVRYNSESRDSIARDKTEVRPVRVAGLTNLLWLALVVVTLALVTPDKPLPGTQWRPFPFLREVVLLALAGLALAATPAALRRENRFTFAPIAEVAALFIGIFITMQVPIEILHHDAPRLASQGFTHPWQYFWATGALSSFLDNAPTYLVFFETANQLTHAPGPGVLKLLTGEYLREDLLAAISCGAVFMGANTYIGNGPNLMVRNIAHEAGVKMPSFFGYMAYSLLVMVPMLAIIDQLFFRN